MHCRHPLVSTSLVATAAISLLTAGCGSGSSRTAVTTTQNGVAALVAYSHCMRSHGVPNFPDPARSEGIPKDKIPAGSPQFLVAQRGCQHLMPSGGLGPQPVQPPRARLVDALAFARCMRTHGFPMFPDPTATGELNPEMVSKAGIDLHQPAVLQAGDACVSVTHGFLTKAKIAQVVNGTGG